MIYVCEKHDAAKIVHEEFACPICDQILDLQTDLESIEKTIEELRELIGGAK